MSQSRLSGDEGLDDYGLGVSPDLLDIDLPLLGEVPESKSKRSFMPDGVIIWILILHEVVGILIDSIIRQMHAHILNVILIHLFIGLSC